MRRAVRYDLRPPGGTIPNNRTTTLAACLLLASAGTGRAQYDLKFTVSDGIEFSTIPSSQNAPFTGSSVLNGMGVVSYDFRIARTEVTTGIWRDFVNTYSILGSDYQDFARPSLWGADQQTFLPGGGKLYDFSGPPQVDPADEPVLGISWFEAAMFCNWLHNGRPTDFDGLRTGAYDLSGADFSDTQTFGLTGADLTFEARQALPGARYRIPTVDEWLKAAYFRPTPETNSGEWDEWAYGLDHPPIPGFPGEGETSADLINDIVGVFGEEDFPSADAYSQMQSPWGLWDISGGGSEIADMDSTQFVTPLSLGTSLLGASNEFSELPGALLGNPGLIQPFAGSSLRLVAYIPSPATASIVLVVLFQLPRRRE